ncbi:MAG: tetratricopeptide repeat protein, partial [Bacteroidales bacterium]|nr:tetratricopeptide repeat protein [Bacteroidales bacterium]
MRLIFALIFSTAAYIANAQHQEGGIVSNFKHLPLQQLFDTANYFYFQNSTDTALVCYSLVINTVPTNSDFEQQKKVIVAYNRSAIIYYYMSDYRTAYELYIKALLLCEKFNYTSYESRILTNIGGIYHQFNKYDVAKQYYKRALSLSEDTTSIIILLNNIAAAELEAGNMDSAFYYFSKALPISKRHNNFNLYNIQNNMALYYQKERQYDSAFRYFGLSLTEARKDNQIETEANVLSKLSNLFLEVGKADSALLYIKLSNRIATQNNFLKILAENHLTLSKIEESIGRKAEALEHFKTYTSLMDSVLNVEKFSDISQLQRLYEISKTNQQIEQLTLEQQLKKRIIYYQQIGLVVLLLISGVLLFTFFQKRKLNTAYKALVEKNREIIELQEHSSEKYSKKYQKSALNDDMQDELLDKIVAVMEDTSVICDTNFSIDKLAELVQSNHAYVSQTINNVLKKNFRSFLNEYRMREAQRLLSEQNTT